MPAPTEATWLLAENMYVLDRRSKTEIAISLEIDLFELGRIARDRNWDLKRTIATEIIQRVNDQDPLKTHEALTMRMLRIVETLMTRLEDADIEWSEQRALRSKIESLKSLAEASNNTIKTHRETRGLRPGTPSAQGADDADGISYVVRVQQPPAIAGTGTGA